LKRVVIGGSACPRAMTKTFQDIYGVDVVHAWGMTEMSPLGSLCTMKPEYAELTGEARLDVEMKQGHPPFGVEMTIPEDNDKPLPWDGKTFGRLKVRGPAVAKGYYKVESDPVFEKDGWFDTGDVATMDRYGYMQITDRAKDVIKSGGEWISSIDLENLAVGHPKVAEAAVIWVSHPKWDERPLLVIVLKKGESASKGEILGFMQGKIAKWWMPDDEVFVDEIPHTATGKIKKLMLRQQVKDYRLPTVQAAEYKSHCAAQHAARPEMGIFGRAVVEVHIPTKKSGRPRITCSNISTDSLAERVGMGPPFQGRDRLRARCLYADAQSIGSQGIVGKRYVVYPGRKLKDRIRGYRILPESI